MGFFEDKPRLNRENAIAAFKLITDNYSAKILLAASKRPISDIEISKACGITIAVCCSRIQLLQEFGLLTHVDNVINRKRKKIKLYLSQVKNAYIFYKNRKLCVRFELKSGDNIDFEDDASLLKQLAHRHPEFNKFRIQIYLHILENNPYAEKILTVAYKKPKSAQEISQKYGIPIAICNRLVRELEQIGLLKCVETVLDGHKQTRMYLSQLKNAYIFPEKGMLRVRFDMKDANLDNWDLFGDPEDLEDRDNWGSDIWP